MSPFSSFRNGVWPKCYSLWKIDYDWETKEKKDIFGEINQTPQDSPNSGSHGRGKATTGHRP